MTTDQIKKVNSFLKLVAEMRKTQTAYFKTKDHRLIPKSKELEKRVDADLKILFDEVNQAKLFTT